MSDQENHPKFIIPYETSPSYKAATIDSAIVNSIRDLVGTTIQVTFTRIDTSPVAESFPGEIDSDGYLVQKGASDYEAPPRKIKEFAALLRPDHAFSVATAIIKNLSGFDENQRNRYNIPEIQLAAIMEGLGEKETDGGSNG